MKIISFAWTTQALLDGKKTVTRRDWNDRYAKSFHKGDIVSAYDKNSRSGGKKIAEIRLTSEPYKQWLHEITDEDEIKEGGLWGSGKAYQEAMGDKMKRLWVIEFELISTCDSCKDKNSFHCPKYWLEEDRDLFNCPLCGEI